MDLTPSLPDWSWFLTPPPMDEKEQKALRERKKHSDLVRESKKKLGDYLREIDRKWEIGYKQRKSSSAPTRAPGISVFDDDEDEQINYLEEEEEKHLKMGLGYKPKRPLPQHLTKMYACLAPPKKAKVPRANIEEARKRLGLIHLNIE